MKIRMIIPLVAGAGLVVACGADGAGAYGEPTMRDSIRAALEYQVSHYPASQYRDIYKNFMQDFFGPGHILADTAASGRYLRQELASEGPWNGPLYEPTGFRGNFYRVNLSLIRDGVIPYDVFFDAFVSSVRGIIPPDGDTWMHTWAVVDSVITEQGIKFENEEQDRRNLAAQFAEGNYIAHHSRAYNEAVHFHYRIVSRDNFENILLPLINSQATSTSAAYPANISQGNSH